MLQLHVIGEKSTTLNLARTLAQISEEQAFYLANLSEVLRKHEEWLEHLPRVKPYYAMKCNNNEGLLKLIAGLELGFDCASKQEMQTILGLNVHADRIIYAYPNKPLKHLKYAADHDVKLMTFDSKEELLKIKELFPSASFHVGSMSCDPTAFARAIAACKELFMLSRDIGHNMDLLDIGGGYPGMLEKTGSSFPDIAKVINEALEEHFPHKGETKAVNIIAEPGNFFPMTAFTYCCEIQAKRCVAPGVIVPDLTETKPQHLPHGVMYYIPDGWYGTFRDAIRIYGRAGAEPLVTKNDDTGMAWSRIYGPTCDDADVVNQACLLPEMELGDWLCFKNRGAYSLVMESNFNGFPSVSKVHYCVNQKDLHDVQTMTGAWFFEAK